MVCNDVEIEPVLQNVSGEQLSRGFNTAPDVRLGIHARWFWENQRSAFFDVKVCHPNAESYRDLQPNRYTLDKSSRHRIRKIYPTSCTGGIGKECMRYQFRLHELISIKKENDVLKLSHGSGPKPRFHC